MPKAAPTPTTNPSAPQTSARKRPTTEALLTDMVQKSWELSALADTIGIIWNDHGGDQDHTGPLEFLASLLSERASDVHQMVTDYRDAVTQEASQ